MRQDTALAILKTGRNVFLTGEAGSGKTHVLRSYIEYLKEHGIPTAVTASTGIAATHIGGTTVHSFSGIGAREYLDDYALDALTQKRNLVRRFEATAVLILDEISMISASFLETLDMVAKELRRSNKPFGGMQVVFSGDFFQLPPVARGDEMQFAYIAPAWKGADLRTCYLSEQHRHTDDDLSDILRGMRSGKMSAEGKRRIMSRLNIELEKHIEPTRLYTHNRDADQVNQNRLTELQGRLYAYTAKVGGRKNLRDALVKSVLAPEILELKEGAAVMFVKNNFDGGYANGTRGTVVDFSAGLPVVETLEGNRITVENVQWQIEEDGKILATFEQLPLRLAWAITIHKSQGMSLDAVEIDLSKAFVPGQGYVALSRGKRLSKIKLNGVHNMAFESDERVVYFDNTAQEDSKRWERIINGFSRERISALHSEFIEMYGGQIGTTKEPKKSTVEKTKELLLAKKTPKEIAEERKLTLGTIIGHIEKILARDSTLADLIKLPPTKDVEKIVETFRELDTKKASPVFNKLNGQYSYETLRLVYTVEKVRNRPLQ